MRVVFDGVNFTFTDTAGMTVRFGPCHSDTATQVTCSYHDISGVALETLITVRLADTDPDATDTAPDRFSYQGPAPPNHSYLARGKYFHLGISVGGGGSSQVTGSPGDDKIESFGSGPAMLDGGDGNDLIAGSFKGHDTLVGGNGNDTVYTSGGRDNAFGGPGNDGLNSEAATLNGDDGIPPGGRNSTRDNTLRGGPGNDNIQGGGGNDLLYGEAGRDAMSGGHQDDRIDGGPGDDLLRDLVGSSGCIGIPAAHDTFIGGAGRDLIKDNCGAPVLLLRDGARDTVECDTDSHGGRARPVVADRIDRFPAQPAFRQPLRPSRCRPGR
jgi:hypothetical protein